MIDGAAVRSRWPALGVMTVVLLAGCGDDGGDETAAEAPARVAVLAGVNDQQDPNIAVNEFLPGAISVRAGASVEWRFLGPEPHSVTFLAPDQQLPPLDSPELEALLAPSQPVVDTYDGESLVSSGLRPLGTEQAQPFRLTFPEEGEYSYVCVIHPLMTGTVTVAGEDVPVDTQADINDRADRELAQWLDEGRAAKQRLIDTPPEEVENPDGTTAWTYQMGATTEHTEVLAFSPSAGEVQPGASVRFLNNSATPHTATFPSGGQVPAGRLDPAADTPTGPQPLAVMPAGGPYSSGQVPPNVLPGAAQPGAGPPAEARSFTFTMPQPGSYEYVCIFHAASGMVGTITVA